MCASVRQDAMSEDVTLRFPGMPVIKGVGPVIVAREVYVPKHAGPVTASPVQLSTAVSGVRYEPRHAK